MRRFIMWLVVLGVSVALTGCGLLGGGDGKTETPKPKTDAPAKK